jgi:hypothetical protein
MKQNAAMSTADLFYEKALSHRKPVIERSWQKLFKDMDIFIRHTNRGKKIFSQRMIIFPILLVVLFGFLSGAMLADAVSVIPVAQFQAAVSENGLPPGWILQQYKGTPHFRINHNAMPPHLRMISSGETAFGVKKDLSVNIREYPHLNWTWKAEKLPDGGDIRQKDRDDQSIQIYLVFDIPGNRGLFSKSPSLAYIWDNKAPKDTLVKSPQLMLSNVRYLVLRNGQDTLRTWFTEKRNVLADYCRAFGAQPDRGPIIVKGVLLFINTHHTKSDAEGCIGNIYFTNK